MEAVIQAQEKAQKHVKIADHMLTQTYPLVRDPKLLLSVLESLYAGLQEAVAAILLYEKYHKRINTIAKDFDIQYNMLKLEVANRHNIPNDLIRFVQEVKKSVQAHKNSPVEFSRKDAFVICSPEYKTQVLSVEHSKEAVQKAKQFIKTMNRIIGGKA